MTLSGCLLLSLLLSIVTSSFADDDALHIALLAPEHSPVEGLDISSSVIAIYLSERQLNDSGYLQKMKYNLTWYDSMCDAKTAVGIVVDAYNDHRLDAIIGPPCSDAMATVAKLASHWDIPVVTWFATDAALSNKDYYDTLVRTFGPLDQLGDFFETIFSTLRWKVAGVIYSSDEHFVEMARSVIGTLRENGVAFPATEELQGASSFERKREVMRAVKREARIILLTMPVEDLRDTMLAAHDEDMVSGDFVFFSMQEDPDLRDITTNKIWQRHDSRDQDARVAMETVFHVSVFNNFSLSNDSERQKLNDLLTEAYEETLKPPWSLKFPLRTSPSTYSGSLADALTLYVTSFVELREQGLNPLSGTEVFQHFQNRPFMGSLGRIIMDDKADRKNNFVVLDMDENGNFVPVYFYEWRMLDGNVTLIPRTVRLPVWAKGVSGLNHIPKDTPVCGFDGSLCPDDRVAAITATCATIGTLFIFFVVILVFVRRNQKRAMTKTIWRVDYDQIDFSKNLTHSRSQRSLRNSRRGLLGETFMSRTTISASTSIPSLLDADYSDEILKQVFTLIGVYHGSLVAVRKIRKATVQHNFPLYQELARMRTLMHPNVNTFLGACLDPPKPLCLVWTYCGRGSLADVIWNEEMKLDMHFKWSFMADIAKGMEYLHHSFLESHGRLKSTNVTVDSRWICKVTDYGAGSVLQGEAAKEGQNEDAAIAELFWTAPELLREESPPRYGTKKGDVYSFGVIVKEIQKRSGPYSEFEDLKPKDIIKRIQNRKDGTPFRPSLDHDCQDGDHGAAGIARVCWEENPDDRPSFSKVLKMISHFRKGTSTNIMDNMVQMLEKYADSLEDIVAERTELLEQEKRKTDLLLYRMLPPSVADSLKHGRRVDAEWYEDVTIYFSDVVSFTTLASESTPMQIVDMLNSLYTLFDDVITLYDVYKVETIGDAYMIVSGLPERNGKRHVTQIADTALKLCHAVDTGFTVPHLPSFKLQIRIGLHTGPCAAGVVGLAMPRYCLFGDTVNTASRMESHGEAMKIHMSSDTYQALSEQGCYRTVCRGEVLIKGKGPMVTYWLEGKEDNEEEIPGRFTLEDLGSENETEEEAIVNGDISNI